MTEKELDAAIAKLCRLYGWRRYHTYRSKRSPAGFPDLVLVKPPRLIFAELKSDDGKVSAEQAEWALDLEAVSEACRERMIAGHPPSNVEAFVWRPRDLDAIARILAPRIVSPYAYPRPGG